MKILLTADPEIPVPPNLYGGIERIINDLIAGLRANGHTVGLAAHKDSSAKTDFFYPWPGLKSQGRTDMLRNTIGLAQAAYHFKPDVIHSFSRIFYLSPLFFSAVPKIMSYQRAPTYRTTYLANHLCRNLIYTGISDYICNLGKKSGGKWHRIYNFLDLAKFTFQPEVQNDAPLVFLSRVEEIKGPHNAIRIALTTGKRLIIAGNHSAMPLDKIYWEREILPHIGKNGIEYIGAVDDKQKNVLLGKALAMVVPVEWDEPFGIVFTEALACGTPVISCPRGALPEIIRNGEEGYLVSNVEQGCEAVRNIGKIDRKRCRERVERLFSSEVVISQYEKLYESL